MICQKRNRTEQKDIAYALHLYFYGLSLRNTSKALSRFVKRSNTSVIRDGIQRYKSERLFFRKIKISEFIIDEAQLKIGTESIWLWVAIEPKNKEILSITISKERNMFAVAERILSNLLKKYGKNPISADGGTYYPQACRFLKLKHHLHSSQEKSVIERTMQLIKDRTEGFDDYLPGGKKRCTLNHVKQWLNLFADYYNREITA